MLKLMLQQDDRVGIRADILRLIQAMIIAVMHTTEAVVKKPENNLGLNGIRTHDLCGTGAVLYQLSYQANWELVT